MLFPQDMKNFARTLCYESPVMLKSRHLFKHYRQQEESRSKRWQMPPSPARRCTWVLVFFRKSSPELLNGFSLFEGKGITLHLVPFLLQFVFMCLFWELAQGLGSWWYKLGPSPNVLLQVRFHITVLSPFICQALAHPLSHVLLFWRGLAVCPVIGHSVRGRLSTKTSARGGLTPAAKA